jgi:N-carbamoyl-L-amino-acid hydrolase
MALERWKEDLIALGEMGRKNPVRADSYEQLDHETGLYRLEGTAEIKQSKDYVIARMKEAGLTVRIDKVGNIFARREGARTDKGAVMSGSHLDSVISGGMFDGALGVVSALEAVRIMNDEGYGNERPIEVVVFMGEEGSAFKKGLLGSDVATGKRSVEEALALTNDEGLTLRETLEKLEGAGDFKLNLNDVEYFIETHVEQGPVLDNGRTPVGIVENITGITWVAATIEGEANHAGTTPMPLRRDALTAAAAIVLLANKRAREMVQELGGSTVATVGKMVVHPGAPNIIPGSVEMGIDIRDGIEANMKSLRAEIIDAIQGLEMSHGVKTTIDVPIDHPPCPCSMEVVEALDTAAREMGIKTKRMNSGAGHDAQNMAAKVKTGMLFVPSVKGISHSPMEWTNWEDIEKGIQVLTRTLKNLSKLSN